MQPANGLSSLHHTVISCVTQNVQYSDLSLQADSMSQHVCSKDYAIRDTPLQSECNAMSESGQCNIKMFLLAEAVVYAEIAVPVKNVCQRQVGNFTIMAV